MKQFIRTATISLGTISHSLKIISITTILGQNFNISLRRDSYLDEWINGFHRNVTTYLVKFKISSKKMPVLLIIVVRTQKSHQLCSRLHLSCTRSLSVRVLSYPEWITAIAVQTYWYMDNNNLRFNYVWQSPSHVLTLVYTLSALPHARCINRIT
jgi:hypothetical protein